jgi:hypothetical protein
MPRDRIDRRLLLRKRKRRAATSPVSKHLKLSFALVFGHRVSVAAELRYSSLDIKKRGIVVPRIHVDHLGSALRARLRILRQGKEEDKIGRRKTGLCATWALSTID